MATLVRDGVALGYEEAGTGAPAIVFVHGVACHRGFWAHQIEHFSRQHRVVTVDLRGHGASDGPVQRYTIGTFADDVAWMCRELALTRPVVVGHSLGGLVALALAASHPMGAVVLIDSVLLATGDRTRVIGDLVASLRAPGGDRALRDYFATFFGPADDPQRMTWILDQAVRTQPHVTSSVWEEAMRAWDDADALRRCEVPLLYLDAGTANADLRAAVALKSELVVGRTVGSGHFSMLEVPQQVNAMLDRFLTVGVEN